MRLNKLLEIESAGESRRWKNLFINTNEELVLDDGVITCTGSGALVFNRNSIIKFPIEYGLEHWSILIPHQTLDDLRISTKGIDCQELKLKECKLKSFGLTDHDIRGIERIEITQPVEIPTSGYVELHRKAREKFQPITWGGSRDGTRSINGHGLNTKVAKELDQVVSWFFAFKKGETIAYQSYLLDNGLESYE